jgi:hypothetical protein
MSRLNLGMISHIPLRVFFYLTGACKDEKTLAGERSISTVLEFGGRVSIPGRPKNFCFLHNAHTNLLSSK